MVKEHLITHIDVKDSYLKKSLHDHAPSVMQNARRANTLKSYRMYFSKRKRWTERFEEVKPVGEKFNIINKSWLAIKAYHKFCGYNICNSFFCLSIYEGVKHILQCIPGKKSSITPHHLLLIYNLFNGENSNFRDLRTLTICILAYAGQNMYFSIGSVCAKKR